MAGSNVWICLWACAQVSVVHEKDKISAITSDEKIDLLISAMFVPTFWMNEEFACHIRVGCGCVPRRQGLDNAVQFCSGWFQSNDIW